MFTFLQEKVNSSFQTVKAMITREENKEGDDQDVEVDIIVPIPDNENQLITNPYTLKELLQEPVLSEKSNFPT